MATTGKLSEGKASFESAIEHQRRAVQLARSDSDSIANCSASIRSTWLTSTSSSAPTNRLRIAIEIPKSFPESRRAEGCFDAARILARLVSKLNTDEKIGQAECLVPLGVISAAPLFFSAK